MRKIPMNGKRLLAFALLIVSAGSALAQDASQDASKDVVKAPATASVKLASQDKNREQKLAEYLSGVKFVGSFTVTGSAERPPEPESYYILSAEKMEDGDWWKLTARIKYATYDLTVPMAMEIKWAGETPVITVDQMAVPGMGTFDARVLIRKGSYAGTWAHDKVGGQLFGRLEKMTAEELAEVKAAAEKSRDK